MPPEEIDLDLKRLARKFAWKEFCLSPFSFLFDRLIAAPCVKWYLKRHGQQAVAKDFIDRITAEISLDAEIYDVGRSTDDFLRLQVEAVVFPEDWKKEGVKPPTVACKGLTLRLLKRLYHDYQLLPRRVAATIEGGMFVKYIHPESGRELLIEVYNDLDEVATITRQKQIIQSYDFDDSMVEEIITQFKSKEGR